METLTFEGILTALTTIHTGGDEKTGVENMMRKLEFIVDDERELVPIIDGNSIRGNLRRLLLRDFFDQIGYVIKTPRLFYMFSGGALEEVSSQDSGTMNLLMRREIRALIPPLSLFGCSMGNQAFTSKLVVAKALPICRELNNFIPPQSKLSFHEYITESFATRRAEREIPESVQMNQRVEEPTIQMKVSLECFAPGTRFYHKFKVLDATPIEKSCFARMVELWRERPYVGGKSAVGYGEIKIDYPKLTLTSETYLDWLQENKVDIVRALAGIDVVPKAVTKQTAFKKKDKELPIEVKADDAE
jgi:CRISPR/Cas system CSM-associated protein Csm3 (group 7 of RAMP superfamily)